MQTIVSSLMCMVLVLATALSCTPAAADPSPPPPAAPSPAGQTVAGDWKGLLDTGAGTLHLVFHFQQKPDGSFAGTLDSVDQGAFGIPLDTVTVTGATAVDAELKSISGSYVGTLSADGSSIVGTWTQGKPMPLTLTRMVKPATPVAPSKVVGDWIGTLDTGTSKLRLAFHFVQETDGTMTASIDSIDQGAMHIPCDSATVSGTSVHVTSKVVHGVYDGVLSADSSTITGTWTQGQPLPLNLVRQTGPTPKQLRPQEPKPPYPYKSSDITFPGPAGTLAGTITRPFGAGPFPGVVLIAGSGPNTRDEPLLGHQLFLVLADYLTRRGIAVLRYDKRGTGQSEGDYATSTIPDFAADAHAAFLYLRSQPMIDAKRVGLIGHSEGGYVAPAVAAEDKRVAFVVMMAGPGVSGQKVILLQQKLIYKSMGASDEDIAQNTDLNLRAYAILDREPDNAKATAQIEALTDQLKLTDAERPAVQKQLDAIAPVITAKWYRSFLNYDPASNLAALRCPVLAIIGSHDLQVPPSQNIPALRAAFVKSGNKDATVLELPDLNHLFQKCKTGALSEYGEIEETLNPLALKTMGDWIVAHTGKPGTGGNVTRRM